MTAHWDPKKYGQFIDLRTRPAHDLLAAIPDSFQPQTVYDLGCGPGNSTHLLKNRWPHAKIIGFDSSTEMLNEAKFLYPEIYFMEGDIAHFSSNEKIDCLFANASLQWLDNHHILIPKLLETLNAGGVFAIQMPNNFHSALHQTSIQILQSHMDWQPYLRNLRYGVLTTPLYQLSWYYDLLINSGMTSLQLWETEYLLEMPDYQSIFDWVKGTALLSVMSAMGSENQTQFKNSYVKAMTMEYPLQENNKILLPFRRIFMVGSKK